MALARASFHFISLQHICDQLVNEVSMTCQGLWDKEGNKSCYLIWRLSEVIGPRVFLGSFSGTFLHAYRTAFHVRRHFPTRQKKCPWTYLDSFESRLRDQLVILGSISFSSTNSLLGLLTVGICTPFKGFLSYSGHHLTLEWKPTSPSPSQSHSRFHSLSFVKRITKLLTQFSTQAHMSDNTQ